MKGNQVGGIAWLNGKIKAIAKRVTKNEQDIGELNSNIDDICNRIEHNTSTTGQKSLGYNVYLDNGTHYVAECDGYVRYYVAKGAPKRRLMIYDANGKFMMQDYSLMSPSGVDLVSSPIFIKKGMQFALDSATAGLDAAWYTDLYWTPFD